MYSNCNWGHDLFSSHCYLASFPGILDAALYFFPIVLEKGFIELKSEFLVCVSGSFPDHNLTDPCATGLFLLKLHPTPFNYFLLFFVDIFFTNHMPVWPTAGLHPVSPIKQTVLDGLALHVDSARPWFGPQWYDPQYANLLIVYFSLGML